MARPSKFSPTLARKICVGIMDRRSIRQICAEDGMPACSTVFKWIHDFPKFSEQYTRAKEVQAEQLAEEMVDIADDGTNDFIEVQKKNGTVILCDQENINRSRLRVDTRKWVASKLLPKKYGDKVAAEVTGENGGPIVFRLQRIGSEAK